MLLIAGFGLVINLIAMKLLHAGSGESLNVKGAYLEVWSDMLGSVAVIIGALLIRWTGWQWIDPVLAVLIGLWVLPRTWVLLREAINVLLEGVPKGIDLPQVQQALASYPGVEDVHDLHVWALASSTPALTARGGRRDHRPRPPARRPRRAAARALRDLPRHLAGGERRLRHRAVWDATGHARPRARRSSWSRAFAWRPRALTRTARQWAVAWLALAWSDVAWNST